jgi:hypothetical protein
MLGLGKIKKIKIEVLTNRLQDKSVVSTLRLRCFFLIAFNKFLLPSMTRDVNMSAALHIRDLNKIPEFDWCDEIYKDLRNVVQA